MTFQTIKLKCKNCEDVISSKRGGDFVTCKCFKNEEDNKGIFMDRDRWMPERYRIGGDNYEVIEGEL